jgi:hypothetical protein
MGEKGCMHLGKGWWNNECKLYLCTAPNYLRRKLNCGLHLSSVMGHQPSPILIDLTDQQVTYHFVLDLYYCY